MCPQLARIEGLAKGAAVVTGVTRCTDQEGKTVRRGRECLCIFCTRNLSYAAIRY